MSQRSRGAQALITAAALPIGIATVISLQGFAQDRRADGRLSNPGLPGWCETPVSERKADVGCYTTAITALGELPQAPLFWYVDRFPTRDAAEASRGPRATVVESHKKFWVFTIAEQGWPARAGERVAAIGPLVTVPGAAYTARYLETVIPSGAQKDGMGHRHPGPEAWYVLEGGQCLETPNGVLTARAGQTMIAPEGAPMAISSLGPDTRRAIVLILHRSDEPYSMPVGARPELPHSHWKPQGLCASQAAAPLEGAWRVVAREIPVTTSPSERSDPFAHVPPGRQTDVQPGLLIFSKRHYSRVTDTAVRPRPVAPPAIVERPTADELLARWGNFQANAGTYEVAGDVLTLRVLVAKDPRGQSNGEVARLRMTLNGNVLRLTPFENSNGRIAAGVTTEYVRVD